MKYILEHIGEIFHDHLYISKENVLNDAKDIVRQYICDHHRHNLPINVRSEKNFQPDIRIYEVSEDNEIKLPLQEWLDEYYQDMKDYKKEEEEREYRRYLELKAKYETD